MKLNVEFFTDKPMSASEAEYVRHKVAAAIHSHRNAGLIMPDDAEFSVEEVNVTLAELEDVAPEAEPAIGTSDVPCKAYIIWGAYPEPGDSPTEYNFKTQAELDAFLEGVKAASGYLDHAFTSPNAFVLPNGEIEDPGESEEVSE